MDVRKAVGELLPEVAKRADEVEAGRKLTDNLVDDLRAAGCLRMLVPAEYGGLGLPMPQALRVIEELATADGSVAWSVGQVGLSQLIIGCAQKATVDAVYADGPDVYAAGAVAPKGRATAIDGGWRITGQWPFVTGSQHASWLYLNCLLVSDRAVQVSESGTPLTRIMLLPAAQAQVVDTWHTLGLRGTGSHDIAVAGATCLAAQGVELVEGSPETMRAVNSIAQSSLIIASVAVGVATGAIDDAVALAAGGKRPSLSATRLAASATFQDRLGEAHTVLRAARALLRDEAEQAWERASCGNPTSAQDRAQTRAAAAQVTTLAASVVDTAYGLAGGSAVYDTSPVQRRMRDVHTATQHFVAGRNSYATVGALLVGEPVDTGMF
ncbi:MAG TPA: acyl-CoA dehydrogenase [Micromonosporaceae bacterium]|nr:acyl-CoA dehydrogenase [Micromonosporaceae bacterium]